MLPRDVTDNAAMFPMVNQIYKEFQVRKKTQFLFLGSNPGLVFLVLVQCS